MRRDNAKNAVIVCGTHAVARAIIDGKAHCVWNIADAQQRLIQQATEAGIPVKNISMAQMASLTDNAAHQKIAAAVELPIARWPDLLNSPKQPLVVLDGITDPRNLGAVMRVARAFGVVGVITPARNSASLSAVAIKAAAGAAISLPLYRVVNLRRALLDLQRAGWFLIGVSEKSQTCITDIEYPSSVCWIFGSEGSGIRRLTLESCDMSARIPTVSGEKGCLNVATACAACLAIAAKGAGA